MNFKDAVKIVIRHEGGYVKHPKDPGGETKYGISKRSYPNEKIAELTVERAEALYLADFWNRVRCDEFPAEIRLMLFDAAVNHGQSRSVSMLQNCLGFIPTGRVDGALISKANSVPGYELVRAFAFQRHTHYTALSTWKVFGAGWSKRLLDISLLSLMNRPGV